MSTLQSESQEIEDIIFSNKSSSEKKVIEELSLPFDMNDDDVSTVQLFLKSQNQEFLSGCIDSQSKEVNFDSFIEIKKISGDFELEEDLNYLNMMGSTKLWKFQREDVAIYDFVRDLILRSLGLAIDEIEYEQELGSDSGWA